MLLLGAINRDPRRFERPAELLAERAKTHGIIYHFPGVFIRARARRWPARKAFICLQRIFDHTEEFHVCMQSMDRAERRYSYEPTLSSARHAGTPFDFPAAD